MCFSVKSPMIWIVYDGALDCQSYHLFGEIISIHILMSMIVVRKSNSNIWKPQLKGFWDMGYPCFFRKLGYLDQWTIFLSFDIYNQIVTVFHSSLYWLLFISMLVSWVVPKNIYYILWNMIYDMGSGLYLCYKSWCVFKIFVFHDIEWGFPDLEIVVHVYD